MAHLAITKASATVCRNIASLVSLFHLNGLSNPANSPEVELAIKRMHRQKGRHQQQAAPLTRDLLDQLLAVCTDDVVGTRDRVMLLLGYETMRRRSELCTFYYEDLEALPRGRFGLRLRFSKTDQSGVGRLIPISNELVSTIKDWSIVCGGRGKILRGLYRGNKLRHGMSPSSINIRLKYLQDKAGLAGGALSGHSFRVGAAVDLLDRGESLEKIMLRGGWKSENSAIRYLRARQGL